MDVGKYRHQRELLASTTANGEAILLEESLRDSQIRNLKARLEGIVLGRDYGPRRIETLFHPQDQIYAYDGILFRSRLRGGARAEIEVIPKDLVLSVISCFDLDDRTLIRTWLEAHLFGKFPQLKPISRALSGEISEWTRTQAGDFYGRLQLASQNGPYARTYLYLYIRINADGTGDLNVQKRERDLEYEHFRTAANDLRDKIAQTETLSPKVRQLFADEDGKIAVSTSAELMQIIQEIELNSGVIFDPRLPFYDWTKL